MSKKIVSFLLAFVMLFALTACSSNQAAAPSAAPAEPTENSENASKVKVALICPGAINDGGWNASAYNALMKIQDELGCEVAYSEKVEVAEASQVFRTYARQGYQLVFAHGAQFGEPIEAMAAEFPDTQFVALNCNISGDNYYGTMFQFGENGYFCGMAAAMASTSGKIGVIAPDDAPNNSTDCLTYADGAKSINPNIEVYTAYTGSWSDLPKAKEAADSLIAKGADVLLSLGDAYSIGVFQAAEDAGIKTIGWVTDQNALSPETNICSGLQSIESVYIGMTQRYMSGTLEPNVVQIFGMADEAQGMSTFYGLTDDQVAVIQAAMKDYLDGKLKINTMF